jgi:hypothetical protein
MVEYFKGFDTDVYIPSISMNDRGEQEINYTFVSKELANQAVFSGWFSSPQCE